MSRRQQDFPIRECTECGADLTGWWCDSCGSNSVDHIARAYIHELAAPWRTLESARRRSTSTEQPVSLAA